MSEIHTPDAMGAWNDDGTAWLPRRYYATRNEARSAYARITGCDYIETEARARSCRHAPDDPAAEEFNGEYWVECTRGEPGAFPVWRVK